MHHLKALAKELGKSSGPPGINYVRPLAAQGPTPKRTLAATNTSFASCRARARVDRLHHHRNSRRMRRAK